MAHHIGSASAVDDGSAVPASLPTTPRRRARSKPASRRGFLFGGLAVSVSVLAAVGSLVTVGTSSRAQVPAGTTAPIGATASSSAAAVTQSQSPGPAGSTGRWTQVFGDEFDGTSIDRTRWRVNRFGGSSDDGAYNPQIEGAYYSPDNVSVVDGNAVLTIHSDPKTIGGHSYTRSSGMLSSEDSFALLDGDYVEARVQIPTGDGLWPAFWTLPVDRWPPEIDVFEFYDTAKRDLPQFVYHGVPGADVPQPAAGNGYGNPDVDYRDSWHTYGMLRAGGRLVPYVDGVAYPENGVAYGVDALPQYLVINLAMYSYGHAVDGTSMRIDWLRVWRRQ